MIKLVFSGEIAQGQTQTEVIKRLATLLKQPPAQIEARLFTGKRVVIKQVETPAEAVKWQSAFNKAGAILSALDTENTVAPVIAPAKETVAVAPETTLETQAHVQDDDTNTGEALSKPQVAGDAAGNPPNKPATKRWWLIGLGVVVCAALLLAFWFAQSLMQAKPLTQADNDVLNALVSDELYGIAHVDVASLHQLESLTGSGFDMDSIPGVSGGFWQSLHKHKIDVREQVKHIWVGTFHNGEQANLMWVLTGQFDQAVVKTWLTEHFIVEQDTEAGLLFSWLHETTCEKVSPLLAVVDTHQLIIGDPAQVAVFQARLAANSESAMDLTQWRAQSEKQLASFAVFTPKNLGATFSGMEGMMLQGIGKMASPASGLYLGLSPTILPVGVELSAEVVSNDAEFVNTAYEKINEGLERAKAASAVDWPELTALYERISFSKESHGVRGALKIDSGIKQQLGDLFSAFISSAFSMPKSSMQDAGEMPAEKLDENPPVFMNTNNTTFADYVDDYGEKTIPVGPFGLIVDKLSIDENDSLWIELKAKAKGLSNLSSRQDVTSIEIKEVFDTQNNSLLPAPTCGPDKNRESTPLGTATNYEYVDGKSVASLMVSGTKKIQLPAGTKISEVGRIDGVITYKQPQKLQRVTLTAPLAGQSLEQFGMKLRFLNAKQDRLNYEARGNTDALLYIYARNAKGEPLDSQGASWSDDPSSKKKTVNRGFQGEIASVEIVLVETFKHLEYPFSLDSVAPSISKEASYFTQPAELTSNDWQTFSQQAAPVVTEFGWSKPKVTQTVGLTLMALTDLRFNKSFGFGLSANVYIPFEPKMVNVLGGGTLSINEIIDTQGVSWPVTYRTSFPFDYDGGYYLNGVYQPDEEKSWLKGSANIKERDLKLEGAQSISGEIAVNAAITVNESRILANLGEGFDTENFSLTFTEWGSNTLKFTSTGDLSSLVALKALDADGNVVSQPAKLSGFFGKTEVILQVGAKPSEFVLVQAKESHTITHPFILDLSDVSFK